MSIHTEVQLTLRKERYPTILSSSLFDPNMESTFWTTGGGPFFSPGALDMVKLPTWSGGRGGIGQ